MYQEIPKVRIFSWEGNYLISRISIPGNQEQCPGILLSCFQASWGVQRREKARGPQYLAVCHQVAGSPSQNNARWRLSGTVSGSSARAQPTPPNFLRFRLVDVWKVRQELPVEELEVGTIYGGLGTDLGHQSIGHFESKVMNTSRPML